MNAPAIIGQKPWAYYNEWEPFAAEWLRKLIEGGHIAPGVVDERSIQDIVPTDLHGFAQCHFFAGIGGWSLALRRSGWSDDRRIWTGSCPCQPFSSAGKGAGFADERHLWPAFFHLISQCKPPIVAGEQVASKDVDPWVDLVQDDLEAVGYRFGAIPFPSAGVGAPHIRDRTYWMADTDHVRCELGEALSGGQRESRSGSSSRGTERRSAGEPTREGRAGFLADAAGAGSQGSEPPRERFDAQLEAAERGREALGVAYADDEYERSARDAAGSGDPRGAGEADRMADSYDEGYATQPSVPGGSGGSESDRSPEGDRGRNDWPGPTNGLWRDADWLRCRDGKWRPVEPGAFPLADGVPNRVGSLRGYGNAINVEAAQAFIESYLETL